tara:strand:+ start:23 stop:214 length:192 start_codon:yes stop_codon:yes gene_type:complete
MIPLHLKKQICMEGGCMLDSVDLMNWIPELIALVIIVLMFIATIGIGFQKAKRSFEKKRGRKW